MDIKRFTDTKTGQLVQVTTDDGPDHAFIPDPLPPLNWEVPTTLWAMVAEAREQVGRLDGMGRNMKNPSLLLDPLQKREALRSSAMEGTYATAKELLLFELAPRDQSSRDDRAREVANYDSALKHGVRRLRGDTTTGLPLSRRLIQEMHQILMEGVRGHDGYAGELRTKHVYVGSNQRYVAPPPGDVLVRCLNDLEAYIHDRTQVCDPLVRSYLVHYQFEAIHPFRDGNGRVGRLLLALTTYQWCNMSLPWLYMSPFFERFKDEYIDGMFRVSTHGDWDRWIEFCLLGTIAQCKDAMRKCEALDELRQAILDNMGTLPRMSPIIEGLFQQPVFTSGEIAKWGGEASPATARRDIEELEKAGWVKYLGGERPKNYYVPSIIAIAYHEGTPEETAVPVEDPHKTDTDAKA